MDLAMGYLWIYGFLLIGGGVMGQKAGSRVSLIMGVVSGLFILISLLFQGIAVVAGISAVLTIVFAIRLIKTKKIMPSGMLFFVSILALVCAYYKL